ncbi:MAG: HEPN domain-containing protein [Verrucomicrobiae bacterium]|nr:HEPN domain-containing protein [Verrucomicrobiae bacterium]MCX7721627.1 HEPN domain-containing protein [Verrucomicrobiae bacterium]MDW7980401.1 HEPN domain-containing protein [Verrucomicrobiales bacterium]
MDDTRTELVRSWLRKASNDLKTATILGAAGGPFDTAIYHCQQAAEKALKAFLVSHGKTPERTHDVRKLAVEASAFEPRFNDYVEIAAALTPYASEFRYPDDLAETTPTQEEFDEALKHAQIIFSLVLTLLPKEAQP